MTFFRCVEWKSTNTITKGGQSLAYRLARELSPNHCRVFVMEVSVGGTAVGQGEGRTKKESEHMAAKAAIETKQ